MGDICSKYLGVATRVLVGSQHGSAGPVRPVDEICVDGEPVEVPRSGFNYDLKKKKKNIVKGRALMLGTAFRHFLFRFLL